MLTFLCDEREISFRLSCLHIFFLYHVKIWELIPYDLFTLEFLWLYFVSILQQVSFDKSRHFLPFSNRLLLHWNAVRSAPFRIILDTVTTSPAPPRADAIGL